MSTRPPGPFPEVPVPKLRWRCDADCFQFETTAELPLSKGIIGQERAVKAIQLGLSVKSPGYHIYAQGLTGTGKETTVKEILANVDSKAAAPGDKCYVANFDDADEPQILYLPAGQGTQFRKDMAALVEMLRRMVPAVLESEDFEERRKAIIESAGEKGQQVIKVFEQRVRQENFVLVEVKMGPLTKTEIAPLVDGKPRTPAQVEALFAEGKLTREQFERIQQTRETLGAGLEDVLREAREVDRQIQEAIKTLIFGFGAELVTPRIAELKQKYGGEKVHRYIENVRHHVLENLESFTSRPDRSDASPAAVLLRPAGDPYLPYRVNVIVDNSTAKGVPIVVETHPTYKNVFGTIERTWDRSGQSQTDFTKIKAGSLLRADGGYLVLSLSDVFAETGVYQALKRTLKTNKVDIQGFDPLFLFSASAMKPEPIDVDVKVVLIGDDYSYVVLYTYDPDFRKIFKVKADFDSVMPRNDESVARYAEFVRRLSEDENLLPIDRGGMAGVVEYGVRLAGRQGKLSTRFSDVADLVREASYWARAMGSDVVREEHVDRAVAERIDRLGLVESKIQELIEEGTLMIASEGSRVGQINGLSVYDMGDYAFGRPTRLTAAVSMGRGGIINIEREADLSGKTHNKGVLILAGYFRQKFARKRALTFSASLAFEQSYSGVDGDSASSTELYVLLSALSDLPLRQDVAVTGSVNQLGEIQPIGGVNQKVEGFYDVCRARGLTGTQGVMIPIGNVADLMLRKDVVAAVAAGKFHVHPIRTVEEGIELLTGVPAGERDAGGNFPPDSVYGKVESRLAAMAEAAKDAKEKESDVGSPGSE